MKMIILVAVAFVAIAAAAPPASEPVLIVRSDFQHKPDGGYDFNYETADGSVRVETGELKQVIDDDKKPHDVVVVRGSYTYIDSEGKPQTVNYSGDEFGYQATGDIIPKPVSRR